jgi:hypothetical protein
MLYNILMSEFFYQNCLNKDKHKNKTIYLTILKGI